MTATPDLTKTPPARTDAIEKERARWDGTIQIGGHPIYLPGAAIWLTIYGLVGAEVAWLALKAAQNLAPTLAKIEAGFAAW